MEFCVISSPEVATLPALDALAGAKSTPWDWNHATASGVEGILAPPPGKAPMLHQSLGPLQGQLILRGAG